MIPVLLLALAGCATPYKGVDTLRSELLDPPISPAGRRAVTDRNEARRAEIEDRLREPLTADVLVAALILRNPGLLATMNEWEAAVEAVGYAGKPPDPRLRYTYWAETPETRVGAQRNVFMISQMFPFFGKLAYKEAIASKRAEMARERFDAASRDLIARGKEALYRYYFVEKAIGINRETVDLLERLGKVARNRYEANQESQHTVLKIQTEIDKHRNELITLGQKRDTIVARLNTLLNRKPDAPLGAPADLTPRAFGLSIETLYEAGLEHRQELRAVAYEEELQAARKGLAERQYWPDLTVGMTWIETQSRAHLGSRAPRDNGKDPLGVTFGLNLPIWIGSTNAKIREAERRRRAARRKAEKLRNDILFQVRKAHLEVDTAWRRIELLRGTQLPNARTSLEVAEAEYVANEIDFLDFLDAERTWLMVNLDLHRAIADYDQALSRLERAVGIELSAIRKPE